MTDFDAAIAPYIDEDGLVLERPNSSPGPDTGNGLHGLAIVNLIRFKRRELTAEHVLKYIEVVRSCEVKPWSKAAPIAGLYHRGPRKIEEMTGHDDYRMVSAVSSLIGAPFAREIESRGRADRWSFDNLSPGVWSLRTWQYRFPGVVAAYKLQAGIAIGSIDAHALALGIWMNAWSKNAGGRLLWWASVEALKGRLPIVDEAISVWWSSINTQWDGGIKGVLADYYDNDDDPRALFCPAGH